jgi:two-component system sensor histidine kinase/response regulator
MRLQQILINLGGNSVKFTERGEVVIGVRRASREGESEGDDGGLVCLEFSVRDTGIGISPEHQTRIFSGFTQAEASTTRRFGGTGLGLAICQRLVGMMGGELRLDSTPGEGTTFSFTVALPKAPVPARQALPAPSRGANSKGCRALVVDDHPTARELLQAMAQSLGWKADTAGSGEEAVAMVAAADATGDGYSAIFVDWQMPGIDGWETCRRIRQTEKSTAHAASVVVMVTAHGREALAQRSEQDQKRIDGFLVKPITASMLLDAVADAGGIASGPTSSDGRQRLAGMQLLLVEDNINNQQIALELLEAEGAVVQIAGNGHEAVAAVAASAGNPFDAVLMDLQMPEMDGFEATMRIRQWLGQATLPIIAMTANAMADDREACLAAGMNDHVGKPFDLAHLIEVLRRHTGRASLAEQAATAQATRSVPDALIEDAQRAGIDLAGALRRTGGNEGAYLRMLRSFLKEAPAVPAQFAGHLAEDRPQEASRLMHTMKGLAGTLGVTHLAELTGRVEGALNAVLIGAAPAGEWAGPVQAAFDQGCRDLARIADALQATLLPLPVAGPADPDAGGPQEVEHLLERLSRLAVMLAENDMAAMDLYAEIEAAHGALLGEHGRALEAAVSALDFGQALGHCRELSGTFGNPSSTRTP